jgi:hypothetical protein
VGSQEATLPYPMRPVTTIVIVALLLIIVVAALIKIIQVF